MTRRKDDKKKILEEEVRRAASETAKRAGENPEERKKKSAFIGAMALVNQTLNSMADGKSSDYIESLLQAMVDNYDQKTVNEALVSCFEHTEKGNTKRIAENGLAEMTKEDKKYVAEQIFFMSFWVNAFFLEKDEREEREKRDWVTMFIGESDDKNEDGGNKNGKKEE